MDNGWQGILFEPNTVTFKKLCGYHKDTQNVELIMKGVSNVNGTVKFNENRGIAGHSKITKIGKHEIETVKLKSVVGNKKIGILDIDAEGHDNIILKDIIDDGLRPEIIMIESNDKVSEKEVHEILEPYYDFVTKISVNTIWRIKH